MRPGIVNRPHGTGDWLLMFFHDSVLLRDADGSRVHPSGTVILWSDSDGHYYGNTESHWRHSWAHFQGAEVKSIVTSSGLPLNKAMRVNRESDALNCLSSIYRELTEELAPDDFIIGNFLRNTLSMTARSAGWGAFRAVCEGRLPAGVMKAKKMMDATPSNRFTLDVLAKTAGLSVSRFCAEFKRVVGVSPIEYLIRNRMRQARYLLEDRNRNISEVADILGYSDIFQFSKQFKKHFGASPSKIR
ncbi:MAG: helix-turn-helix transcriptional regulator [Victivallales bacterium]|nr:helix-turn-helix transcriptional regulator [Victivallales bacterium]